MIFEALVRLVSDVLINYFDKKMKGDECKKYMMITCADSKNPSNQTFNIVRQDMINPVAVFLCPLERNVMCWTK